jgi:hypothetical protein
VASKRLLVIAPVALEGSALREEIERRSDGGSTEVRLITPAVTGSKVKTVLGDVDDAIVDAEKRLEDSIEGLRSDRVSASGKVGDADPLVAADDELGLFPADEVLIVTHPDAEAEWFEEDLFERAAERFEPPVTHVELGGDAGGLTETEHSSAGIAPDEPDEGELELSRNLPPFSKRDLLGIVVAMVGTLVLVLLAAEVGDKPNTASAAGRILIATAFILVNLAHVIGLVFFNSQQYRGFGRELFGRLSLYGTPLAIVASLLI